MKKSMIAAAVVATAFAATANAGYFAIAGASYNPGSQNMPVSNFSMNTSSVDYTAATAGTGANTISALSGTSVTALGAITTSANTVTYFSFQDAGGLGYFGIIINTSVTRSLTISMAVNSGDGASGGSKGVLTNAPITGEYISGGTFIDTAQSFTAGTYYYIFGGLANGSAFNGSVSRASGTDTFGISYLTFSGSNQSTVTSLASGATSSSISVASYVVPVPAPALLAGAGLVGAAALRRRMAKKA